MTAAVVTAVAAIVAVAGALVSAWRAQAAGSSARLTSSHVDDAGRAVRAAQRARDRAQAAAGGSVSLEAVVMSYGVPPEQAGVLARDFRASMERAAAEHRRNTARAQGGVTGSAVVRAVPPSGPPAGPPAEQRAQR